VKIFVGGEGPGELGKWAEPVEARASSKRGDGVLVALVRRIHSECTVVDGILWKSIRKLQSGGHRSAEERNLLGLELAARESGAECLVWSRDTDQNDERRKQLKNAMRELTHPSVGCPVDPCLESWALALARKHSKPDLLTSARVKELAKLHEINSAEAMETLAQTESLEELPSPSLKQWLKTCRAAPTAQLEPRGDPDPHDGST
jgi:hypothetical protein